MRDPVVVMTTMDSSRQFFCERVARLVPIDAAWLSSATVACVLCSYAMLSWFSNFAEWTGHTTTVFKLGTVFFLGFNSMICVAWLWISNKELQAGTRWLPVWLITWRLGMFWGLLVVGALVYRMSAIMRTDLDPAVADMLPVMLEAGRRVLAGEDPYGLYRFASHETPMQWLPALWLPYVSSVWLKFDPRYLGLAAVVAISAILGVARWTVPHHMTPAVDGDHPLIRMGLAGGLLLAPASVWFGAIGHTQIYWLYLIAFVWALSRQWWTVAGICWGLCMMSRHTLLPLCPLLMLHLYRRGDRQAMWQLGVATCMTVFALLLPFGFKGLHHLFVKSPAYYWHLGEQAWQTTPWWVTHTFGLGVFLYPAGPVSILSWIGVCGLAIVYAIAVRAIHDERTFIACLTLGLLVVTMSVPTPFRYEFFPVLLLLSSIPLVCRKDLASR